VGGPLCCDGQHLAAGPRDQKEVEARQDVLVYSTEPLAEDLEVTGPVTLDLFAKTSAADTDFTAKLVDVAPDGTAINLDRGNFAGAVSGVDDGRAQADHARRGVRVQDRSVVDEQCVLEGAQDSAGGKQLELSALRPEFEYGEGRRHGWGDGEGYEHGAARWGASECVDFAGGEVGPVVSPVFRRGGRDLGHPAPVTPLATPTEWPLRAAPG
jgi:hypothetical protein